MKSGLFSWTCAFAAFLLLVIASGSPKPEGVLVKPGSRVLVADVQSEAGPVDLGARLKQVLSLALDQSNHIKLYSESELHEDLQWLASDPHALVTPGVALQICARDHIPVFVLPRLSRAGASLILSVRLVEVRNNRISKVTPAGSLRARDEPGLLFAIPELGRGIRKRLGEEPSSHTMSGDLFFRLTPADRDALMYYAHSRLLALRRDEAGEMSLLEKVVRLAPEFSLPRLRLSSLYAKLGLTQAAIEQAEVANRYSESLPPKLKHRARATWYFLERQYSNAQRQQEAIAAAFPEDWQTHCDMGQIALRMGEYARAVQEYRSAVRISDSRPESHLGLSIAELYHGNMAAARHAWERAQSTAPEDFDVLRTGVQIDLVDSNVSSALRSLQKVEASPLPLARSHGAYLLAQALIYGGQFQTALARLEAGTEEDMLQGDSLAACRKRLVSAQIQALVGNSEKGLAECSRILRDTTDPTILAAAGILYAQWGKIGEAQKISTLVEKLPSESAAPGCRENLLGEIALASGRFQDAIQAFMKAKELQPGRPPSEALARAFMQAGQREEAAKEYSAVSERKVEILFPQDSLWFTGTWVRALFDASECLLEIGNKREAQQYLRNYLWALEGADASLPTIQEAKELLKAR